jgi:hypothetical protein
MVISSATQLAGTYTLLSTGVTLLPYSCPTGTTSATSATALSGCSNVAAGYYLPVATGTGAACTKSAAGTTGTTGTCSIPTVCPINFYCPIGTGNPLITNGAAISDVSANNQVQGLSAGTIGTIMVSSAAVTAATSVQCPAGTANPSTQSTSAVDCDDLAAGFYIPNPIPAQASAGAVTSLTAGIVTCPAGSYCPYKTNGVNAITAGTTGSTFTWTAIVVSAATPCSPTGTTSGATGATVSSACTLVAPGYYIDPSSLTAPAVCAVGEYCPGSAGSYLDASGNPVAMTVAVMALGTKAGGEFNCPTGSATPGTVASAANSAFADCNLLPNFYIPSTATGAALNVPVSCPAGSHCPGGAAIGTAGGSLVCPTGSTIPACTVAAVTAPAVTTGPVTVSPTSQPINLNATPVVVNLPASAAPRAAVHAAVLALAALAALVAF